MLIRDFLDHSVALFRTLRGMPITVTIAIPENARGPLRAILDALDAIPTPRPFPLSRTLTNTGLELSGTWDPGFVDALITVAEELRQRAASTPELEINSETLPVLFSMIAPIVQRAMIDEDGNIHFEDNAEADTDTEGRDDGDDGWIDAEFVGADDDDGTDFDWLDGDGADDADDSADFD